MRAVIAELAAEHATIVLCTHHLGEVERLCSRAAFIAGRLLAVHPVRRGAEVVRIELAAPHAVDGVRAMCRSLRVEGNTLILEPGAEIPDIVAELVRAGARVAALVPHRDPLEEAWLQLLADAREQGLTS